MLRRLLTLVLFLPLAMVAGAALFVTVLIAAPLVLLITGDDEKAAVIMFSPVSLLLAALGWLSEGDSEALL